MRVLFLVGSLNAGGLERFVTRTSLRATTGGEFEPLVCCLESKEGMFLEELQQANVEVFAAPPNWTRSWGGIRDLCKLIRQIKPEIVHSQVNFSLLQQLIAVRLAGRKRFCVTERSCYQVAGLARFRKAFQFHILRLWNTHYSANGEAVAAHLARLVHYPENKITVLPNGIDLIESDHEMRSLMRNKLGWSAEDVSIGYIGRLAEDKRHVDFIHAFHELASKNGAIRACFLGDGPQREIVEHLITELGETERITLAGTVNNVPEFLQAFDIVALFSSREGMPNAILEAMAAGKAIVATSVGALPELLDYGNAGILVHHSHIENLSSALFQVITDKSLREKLGTQARKRAENVYGTEKTFHQLCQYYKMVASL